MAGEVCGEQCEGGEDERGTCVEFCECIVRTVREERPGELGDRWTLDHFLVAESTPGGEEATSRICDACGGAGAEAAAE